MRRSYWILFAGTVLAGLVLVSLGREPRRQPTPEAARSEPLVVLVSLEIRDGSVVPASIAIPKDHRVRLAVHNTGHTSVRFQLAGYEDRISPGVIAPGASRTAEFLADRPGEDFAWLLDGQPTGRLTVTGSHLVEGHR